MPSSPNAVPWEMASGAPMGVPSTCWRCANWLPGPEDRTDHVSPATAERNSTPPSLGMGVTLPSAPSPTSTAWFMPATTAPPPAVNTATGGSDCSPGKSWRSVT